MTHPEQREFEAYQAYLAEVRRIWATDLFADLKARAASDPPPRDAAEVAARVDGTPEAQLFGWFERHLQSLKYSGRLGILTWLRARATEHADRIDPALPQGMCQLDPALEMPAYYRAVDVHQQPGGVWSEAVSGLAYQLGASTTTGRQQPTRGGRAEDLHMRFARLLRARAGQEVRRIADLGCGFGKSTLPLARLFPEAEVVGVDLSAPCLRLAGHDALAEGLPGLRFVQADAAATGLPDAAFDIVTSTMMLHEMPPAQIRAVFAEARRLLRPGGHFVNLDFLPPEDPFLAWVHAGHGQRNNEPWMRTLGEMDVRAALSEAGLTAAETDGFEEADGARARIGRQWRLPWTVIAARKPDLPAPQPIAG